MSSPAQAVVQEERPVAQKRIRIRIEYDETEALLDQEVLTPVKVGDGCFEIAFDRALELDIDTNDKALIKVGYAAMRNAIQTELERLAKKNPTTR